VKSLLPLFAEWFSGLDFAEGLLAIVMALGGLWIYKIHQGRLDDRQRQLYGLQREIDRLVQAHQRELDGRQREIDRLVQVHQREFDGRQREIDRLAGENCEHRDRFTRILERNPLTRLEDHTRQKPEDGV